MMTGLNREAWLEELVEKLRLFFIDSGYELPEKLYISAGFPSKGALSSKKRRIGECWTPKATADGVPHIFISPMIDDALEVAATVVHELGHAVVEEKQAHGPAFKKFMDAVGLEGKPTATHAGPGLGERLTGLLEELGPYPHSKLSYVGPEKKQTTRMLKLVCPAHPEVVVRASKKVIDLAVPLCGMEECGERLEEAA